MKKTVLAFATIILAIFMVSCSATKSNTEKSKTISEAPNYILQFNGAGNEPFWNVTVLNDEIIFRSLGNDDVHFSGVKMDRIMDVAGLAYSATNEKGNTIHVQIIKEKCSDTMADKEWPYQVTVHLTDAEQSKELIGCGEYIADKRLDQTWYLKTLLGEKVYVINKDKPPLIKFDTEENGVSANMGCNGIGGGYELMENTIYFSEHFMSTQMYCEGVMGLEKQFTELIVAKSVVYSLQGKELIFKNFKNKTIAVFSTEL